MITSHPASAIALPDNYGNFKVLPALKKIVWKKLAVATGDQIKFIPFGDVLYCMSANNYTIVMLRNGSSYTCAKTLKAIESKLPPDLFYRVHHSYVVNIQHITALKRQTCELELDSRLVVPISRHKKNELYELFDL